MSTPQTSLKEHQQITPPSSVIGVPLAPPPTDKKAFSQAHRVIELFREIKARRHGNRHPWTSFQLARGEYDEIEHLVRQDESLFRFVDHKIRYDYDGNRNRVVVRMPTLLHDAFLNRFLEAINSQLRSLREGSSSTAAFAQKVYPAGSSRLRFPVDDALPGTLSKHEPDGMFWHDDAKYPGVIIEISYSQKRKNLGRLAEDYLLDSNANVQVVVGLDIEYGMKKSRKATLLVWRTRVVHTADGDELRVFQEIADEPFRDDQGNPTDHLGLRLHLRDFVHEILAHDELGDEDRDLIVSAQQLCQYLNAAETKIQRLESLSEYPIAPGLKKRKMSRSPPEELASSDEAKYVEQEERVAMRTSDDDSDYKP